MKLSIILLAATFSLFSVNQIKAQNEETLVTIPDFAKEKLVKRIVGWYFRPSKKPRTIYISNDGIKEGWLPAIRNIEFVLLNDDKVKERKAVYFFKPPEREGGRLSIEFGRGQPDCEAEGEVWYFRISGKKIRLSTRLGHWGSACGGDAGSGSGTLSPPKPKKGRERKLPAFSVN